MSSRFEELRAAHPVFHYHGYHIAQEDEQIVLRFDFSIENLCEFHPTTTIDTSNLTLRNAFNSPSAQDLVFNLGLVELISYWKCVCPPEIVVHCGFLSAEEVDWWKRLWFHGLGEFFYRNKIETTIHDFVQTRCDNVTIFQQHRTIFHSGALSLVPVGGGKDSCVTLHLLGQMNRRLMGFTVNDQAARSETFAAAGYDSEQLLRTHRHVDPALLARNAEGCWNGHTPFSAIVAFLGLYSAYLIGADELVLSNEASANEASVPGTEVNHQYSKSYAFERDMNNYIQQRFGLPICYFSLLRPFHELQIAKQFAALPQYHFAFKSCNAGSKRNIWCCRCAKCLFVYLMLAPFLLEGQMVEIFGRNLLNSPYLAEDLQALLGNRHEKPFECVGTIEEARAAFDLLHDKPAAAQQMLRDFCSEHNIPAPFLTTVERMLAYVGTTA